MVVGSFDSSTQLYPKSEPQLVAAFPNSSSSFTARKLLLCPTPQVLNLLSQASHLFCCRPGAAAGASGHGCFQPRHAHGAWKAHFPPALGEPQRRAGEPVTQRGEATEARGASRIRLTSRQEASSLRKWGAVVWCPRIDGFAFQRFAPSHQSPAVGAWRSYGGCLTQRRCSFRSKKQQKKSWMLETCQSSPSPIQPCLI